MSSQSVAELNRESVDISSTLSVQMQEAMSKTSSERFGISAAAGLSTTPDGVEAPKFGEDSFSSGRFKSSGGDGTTINIYTAEPNPDATDDEKDDDGTTGTKAGSVSGSFEEDSSESIVFPAVNRSLKLPPRLLPRRSELPKSILVDCQVLTGGNGRQVLNRNQCRFPTILWVFGI